MKDSYIKKILLRKFPFIDNSMVQMKKEQLIAFRAIKGYALYNRSIKENL